MNEAPEKIWLASDMMAWVQYSEEDTPYIRADIVDELLKVLIAIGAGQGDAKEIAIRALQNYMEEK